MKKILLWVISLLSILHVGEIYAQTWDILEDKSIKEIKQNIEKLNSDKNIISNEYSEFKLESDLSSYFKPLLSREELQSIEILITKYNKQFNELNSLLLIQAKNLEDTSETKNQLLQIKKDLYLNLLWFVDANKYQEYLVFIRWDAIISKKQVDVKSQIATTTEIYDKKVTKIEARIIENRQEMAVRLEKVISDKIDEKINTIKSNASFQKLPNNLQVEVLEKTIEKVNINISALETVEMKDSNIKQKINLYYLLNDKLLIFKNSIQEKQKKQWE